MISILDKKKLIIIKTVGFRDLLDEVISSKLLRNLFTVIRRYFPSALLNICL